MASGHDIYEAGPSGLAAEGSAAIETPCVGVCVVEPQSRSCGGCGRTIDEIAAWTGFTPEMRRRIMQELPARRQRVARGVR